jgi:Transglycosylase SLT domain
MRALATPCVVAVVAAFMVSDGRVPEQAVLADGPASPAPSARMTPPVTVPPGVHAPGSHVVRSPASVSPADLFPAGLGLQSIPEPALAAYQRAAVIIDAADHACRLDWTLLAGIGQVESDHGQVGGSHLDSNGVAHPDIRGVRLDGRHGTSLVRDTDAGRLDGDRRFDRAVGPMQFLPATWAAVAVDGDGNGTRNVEDIDDAALGSAVYLCAGGGDLSTPAGARAALLRYNHSQAYVARVMAVARSLRRTDLFTTVETGTTPLLPLSPLPPRPHGSSHPKPSASVTSHSSPSGGPTSSPTSHPSTGPSGGPSGGPTSSPTSSPTGDPTSSPTGDPTSSPTGDPTSSPTGDPTSSPTGDPTSSPTGDPTSSPTGEPTDQPVIPDPVPDALAGLTPEQIQAIDDGWLACVGTLPDSWTFDQMQACLADQLAVPLDDPDLATFLQWAVDQGLVPAREETAGPR